MEFSPLQAIDFSLGRLLVDVYDHQKPNHGPANWRAFLARPNPQRFLRGDFDTVSDILKMMESSQKNAVSAPGLKSNPVNLPLIVYGRKPSIVVADPDAGAYIFDHTVTDNEGNDMRMSAAQLTVDYRVAMMAWDKPTLDTMQLAWLFHVARPGQHRLSYQMQVGTGTIDVTGELIDPKTPVFEDSSLTRDEGRLHAVVLTVTVKTYAIAGVGNIVIPDGFRWATGSAINGHYGLGSNYGLDGTGGIGGGGIGGGNTGGLCDGGACWPNRI